MRPSLLTCLLVLCLAACDAMAGVIPIRVQSDLPDPRPMAPVKFGVPFPRHALKVGEPVQVLDDTNKPVAHQSRQLATWDPTGEQGVRWLLIDFCANMQRQYRIVYGPDMIDTAGQPALPAIARLEENHIVLDTGMMKATIDIHKADLFSTLKMPGLPLVHDRGESAFAGFYVEHETRGVFRADLDPSPSIVLEENGPIRATIKLDGWYTNAEGEQFCRFSIRAHFFKGRGDIRLDHTFIYTGLSSEDRIKSMGLQLPLPAGQRGYLWSDQDVRDGYLSMFTSSAKFVQDSPNHADIELLDYSAGADALRKPANRAPGSLTYGGLTVAIRDAWQQYPWGFDIQDGIVRTELWPSGDRLLDTSFDGYWWFLNEHQKRFMLSTKRGAKGQSSDDWIATYRSVTKAAGPAKTHELWVSLASPDHPIRLQREVAHPVVAVADPAWMTSTLAMDFCRQSPRDDVNFPDEERYLDSVLAMVKHLTEASHWYGWWDWGGYYQLPGYPTGPFRDTHGLNAWHRNRPKSHYGWGQLPWLQYFRTGDPRWLRYAQTYTLYSADRAHVHQGKYTGYEYHYDNSDIPWVGGYVKPEGPQLASNLQQKDDYVYMYWLTGDRRALDVLESWGKAVLDATPAARDGYFKIWKPGFERGNDIRNAGQQLHRLMMLYQATWDERYLDLARPAADAFAAIQTEAQVIAAEDYNPAAPDSPTKPYFHDADGWAYEGLWLYYNVTHDPRIRQTLLAFIERSVNYSSGMGIGYGPARAYTYGYELTGDTLYLDLIRAMMDDLATQWVTPANTWVAGNVFSTITLPRAIGTLASAPEAWRAQKLPTHVRGRTLRYRYAAWPGNPTYTAASEACFHKAQDRSWRFRLLFNDGGQWSVIRPDGSKAYESPRFVLPLNRKWIEVDIPADGQTGTYTLRCEPGSAAFATREQPQFAKVLRSDLPVVVRFNNLSHPPRHLHDPMLHVWGRSLYFQRNDQEATVNLMPAWQRVFGVFVDGRQIASTSESRPDYTGSHALPLPGKAANGIIEVRPIIPTAGFFKDDPTQTVPLRHLWSTGIQDHVAANPEDLFNP